MQIAKFIAYHNAVPIVLGVLFISSGLVFAANEEVRGFVADSVYKAESKVISVDNAYIANKNLDSYSPKVSINNVTEDADFYYVDYTFTTIALEDSAWQDVVQKRVMNVSKKALGDYTDLGVYVTKQLKQLVSREVTHLREVQGIERRQITGKVVATAYSGLVGQFIDDSTQTLPGYTPRIVEPVAEDIDPVAVAKAEKSDAIPFDFEAAQERAIAATSNNTTASTSGPVISVLGSNPARIPLGSSYSDLGVVVTSQEGATLDLSVQLSLNGSDVNAISIDTSSVADWSVGYSVTDQDENTSFAERTVIVYDPNASTTDVAVIEEATTTASTTATTTQSTEETATTTTTESTTTSDTSGADEQTQTSQSTTTESATTTPSDATTTATTTESTATDSDAEPETTAATSTDSTTSEDTTTATSTASE